LEGMGDVDVPSKLIWRRPDVNGRE